ncbi:hypothetical protein QIU18_00315 [Capnocytophaga canimorsus]|nr:hypothetical protein [Capnocytophaga canimorsus]WGU68260.1 hypothetical protein QIU19_13495 [Capnocytophaga canimorsus]WGU70637.1 hypothetical protein QIU18_00315 [Capnocytophaga canimorsus]
MKLLHRFGTIQIKKDLGYGWYAYWAKVNVPEIGAGSFGINSVRGSWLFYAVGVFEANNYVDWSPAPRRCTSSNHCRATGTANRY